MKIPPHPIDSFSPPMTPGEAAWQAAEAVRVLNHLTLAGSGPRAGYTYPSDVDTVLGALQTLAQRRITGWRRTRCHCCAPTWSRRPTRRPTWPRRCSTPGPTAPT